MPNDTQNIGQLALNRALARASAHASTAIVAATLIPLAMTVLPTPAEADYVSVTPTVTPNSGPGNTTTFSYVLNYTGSGYGTLITEVEIPEVTQGAFVMQPNVSGSYNGLPYGWQESEVLTSTLDSPDVKPSTAAAAYIDIVPLGGSGEFLSSGGSGAIPFDLYSNLGGYVQAQMDIQTGGDLEGFSLPNGESNGNNLIVIDPPTPVVATPEPASIATLGTGLALLARLRRRKPT